MSEPEESFPDTSEEDNKPSTSNQSKKMTGRLGKKTGSSNQPKKAPGKRKKVETEPTESSPSEISDISVASKKMKNPEINKTFVKKPSLPTMVDTAIKDQQNRSGTSMQLIKKFISTNYLVNADKMSTRIKNYVAKAVESGHIVQVTGKGASGSFKINNKLQKTSEIQKKQSVTHKEPGKVVKRKIEPIGRSTPKIGAKSKAGKENIPLNKKPGGELKDTGKKAGKNDAKTTAGKNDTKTTAGKNDAKTTAGKTVPKKTASKKVTKNVNEEVADKVYSELKSAPQGKPKKAAKRVSSIQKPAGQNARKQDVKFGKKNPKKRISVVATKIRKSAPLAATPKKARRMLKPVPNMLDNDKTFTMCDES